ncbi:hypothetical protein D5F01_LYC14187 [Larimichthys crocea]|uniref:Uncharacterized protein n=1 Tax=Larimichthys crocea TaxID=215358 RepID=A0A6G0IAA4_LARCR|nr:hypothetical protein D5F01_LYC14187 [Larimichthys crocea]
MWKDTQTERKEIDQMKRRGHEVRNNMEKRLQVINQFVRRTLLQKEPKEPSEKTNLEQGLSKDTTCHTDCKIDHNALDEKYAELEQLKVRMLSEIDKLRVREKVSARTTRDKVIKHSRWMSPQEAQQNKLLPRCIEKLRSSRDKQWTPLSAPALLLPVLLPLLLLLSASLPRGGVRRHVYVRV